MFVLVPIVLVLSTSAARASSPFSLHELLRPRWNRAPTLRALSITPSDIPTTWQPSCTSIVDTLNLCTTSTASVCCSSTNAGELEACVDCVVSLNPTQTNQDIGQAYLTNYEAYCIAGGAPVGDLTLSVSSGAVATSPADSAVAWGDATATTSAAGSAATTESKNNIPGLTGGAVQVRASMVGVVASLTFSLGVL